MLLSNFFLRNTAFALGFKPWRAFCSKRRREDQSLEACIFSESHFSDVIKLVSLRRSQLDSNTINALTKRAQKNLWNKEKDKDQLALELTQMVRSLVKDERSVQELTSFLTLLRNLKFSGFKLKEMADTRNLIIAKCVEKIKKVELGKQNSANLLALYYELAFFKKIVEVKIVAEIIHKLAEADSKEGASKFTDKDVTFYFHSLSHRVDMIKPEVLTRSIFLKRIGKKVNDLSGEEQAKILANLSKTDVIDLHYEDIVIVKQLVQRVEKNISQLGEQPILELARCSNISRLPGFFRVSQEIYKQMFFGINKSGITEFGYEKVLQVIGLLSDKINFFKAHQVEQTKLFSLFSKFAKESSADSGKSREFCQLVHPLIKNRFFNDKQLDQLLGIMESNKLYFSIHFIYDLVVNGKITPGIKDILMKLDHGNFKDEFLVKIGIAVFKAKRKYPELEQPFKILRDNMSNQLKTPSSFIDFFNKFRFRKYNVKLYHFHECFGDLFNALPNPFSTNMQNPQYCEVYLLYISQGPKFGQAGRYIQDVPNHSLLKLIENEISTNNLVTQQNSFVVRAIFEKLPSMLEKREANHVNAVINLLYKYNRLAVMGLLSSSTEQRLFKILNFLVSKLDIVAEIKFAVSLFSMIDRFLLRSYKNYKIQHSYRVMVQHLLENISLLNKHQAKIIGTVVREGLRLDLVNKSMCDQLDLSSLRVNFIEKQRLKYIRDPLYVSEVSRIEPASLDLLLSNHNLEDAAVQAEKYIIQMIQKIPNHIVLCNLLKLYNLRRSPASKRIHSQLLNNVLGRLFRFEGVDIIGVFRNALEKNFYRMKQYRLICEKTVHQFSNNISSYSIYTHTEVIKFIMSQKKMYPQKYYIDLVEYSYRTHVSDSAMSLLLLRLAGSDYKLSERDAKHVFHLMVKSAHNAVFYFLMVEEKLTEEERSSFLKELSKKYQNSQPAGNKSLISKLQYLYLKKKYPTETADLNISQFSSDTICFRLKNSDALSDIQKMSKSNITELNVLGQNEPIYQIKDFIFYFTNSKKYGNTNEHNFNNRALAFVFGLKGKVVTVFQNYNSQMYEQLHNSCFGLFNEEEYRKVTSDEAWRAKRNASGQND